MKERITAEQEQRILEICILHNMCDEFVIMYQPVVLQSIRKILAKKHLSLSLEDIEDVKQEVFRRIFDHDKKFLRDFDREKGCSLAGWIIVIATRTTLNYLRKRRNDRPPVISSLKENAEPANTVCSELFYNKIALQMALEKLSPDDRIIVKLRLIYGMSSKKVASLTDSTQGAVDTKIHRIRQKLKKYKISM